MVKVKVTDDMPDTEKYKNELGDYFPLKYHFRVNIYKYFLKLLLHLEDHFSQYNCAVLDINLRKGFEWIDEGDDEGKKNLSLYKRPEDEDQEMEQVIEIFKKYNIRLKSKHSKAVRDGEYEEFYKNAGYYLYLYLLQRGMPAERICMLTGNGGANNISGDWERLFENAGLNPPNVFDRQECKDEENKDKSDFAKWLNDIFSHEYRFRSCVVAMSGCLLDMIDKNGIDLRQLWKEVWEENEVGLESIRHILENVIRFPLRISKSMEQDCVNIIWQLVIPWEGIKKFAFETKEDKYYRFLKITRNWLAHRRIIEISLQMTAFLFGLSLRGLFNFVSVYDRTGLSIEESKKLKQHHEEYKQWEQELLKLMKDMDDKRQEEIIFSDLSFQSFNCFCECYRLTNEEKIAFEIYNKNHEVNIYRSIIAIISASDPKFFKDIDLARIFLQSLYEISGKHKTIDQLKLLQPNDSPDNKVTIRYTGQDQYFFSKCNSRNLDRIEDKYLDGIKNILNKKIDDDLVNIKNMRKERKNN